MDQQNFGGEQTNEANEHQQHTSTEPQIFKLNVDCFEKLFDYLSIDDLDSFAQTCTRMQRVAGHFYHQELPRHSCRNQWEYVGLRECVEDLYISGDDDKRMDIDWNEFKSLKKLSLNGFNKSHPEFKMLPMELLNQLEHVEFFDCKMNPFNLPLEHFLGGCTNVKYLQINQSDIGDDWMTCKFPQLEHLKFSLPADTDYVDISKMNTFFHQNPSIQSLRSWIYILEEISLKNIKLNDLYIDIEHVADEIDCDFLNMLHANGTYKHLHIHLSNCGQDDIDKLSSLGSLVGLSVLSLKEDVDLLPLLNLRFLTFYSDIEKIANKPALAQSLKHLSEICYGSDTDINDILPFIHLSPQLKNVSVCQIRSKYKEPFAINPVAMNREREKLLANPLYNVKKVTIYLDEEDYLATKWKTTETDLRLIEIRRNDLYDAYKWF